MAMKLYFRTMSTIATQAVIQKHGEDQAVIQEYGGDQAVFQQHGSEEAVAISHFFAQSAKATWTHEKTERGLIVKIHQNRACNRGKSFTIAHQMDMDCSPRIV